MTDILKSETEIKPLESTKNNFSFNKREKETEQAHIEALNYAVSAKIDGSNNRPDNKSTSIHRGFISKSQKEVSFNRTMKHVQAELSPGSRMFSKFIHIKAVDHISEILCSTIARPNAILAGNMSAFLIILGVYILAKNIGYQLSGFETICSFIVGWIIGVIYDYLRVLITGKNS